MSVDSKILVTGATGQQGGATARALLARGVQVRILVRAIHKPVVQELINVGAEVAVGDMDDEGSLRQAMDGVSGVFSVQPYQGAGLVPAEVQQGKNVADAALAAGVRHLVYTSVVGADINPPFESKKLIEEHIRAIGIPATILRPGGFMENYLWQVEGLRNGILEGYGIPPTELFQVIAVEDIGILAALAFLHPDEWVGRTMEIAGDQLTEPQIADTFARALKREVRVESPSDRLIANIVEAADIAALRKVHPDLMTLEQWVHRYFPIH
jgi:uncharacterized protein YbjT (DUF2867 family)